MSKWQYCPLPIGGQHCRNDRTTAVVNPIQFDSIESGQDHRKIMVSITRLGGQNKSESTLMIRAFLIKEPYKAFTNLEQLSNYLTELKFK